MIDTVLLVIQTLLIAVIALQALKSLLKGDVEAGERSKLINALIAKSAEEHRQLQVADKLPVPKEIALEQTNQDLIPAELMTDDEFDKQINQVMETTANG